MSPSDKTFKRVQPALGTWLEISAKSEAQPFPHEKLTEAFLEAKRLETIFNFYDPSSELSRINQRKVGEWLSLSSEANDVFGLGAEIETLSDRAFRLMPHCRHGRNYDLEDKKIIRHCACQFDLGGIAKGYIVDKIFEGLSEASVFRSFSVNAGGDLRFTHPQEVTLRLTGEGGEVSYSVQLEAGAVCTSSVRGDSLRVGKKCAKYSEEQRTEREASAVVVAKSCAVADAMTKVALFSNVQTFNFASLGVGGVLLFDKEGKPLWERPPEIPLAS